MNEFDDRQDEEGRELDRRVLAAARREEPSAELRARMAGALGLSAAAAIAASKPAVAGATKPAADLQHAPLPSLGKAAGATNHSGVVFNWLTWGAGALGVVVVGALVTRSLSSNEDVPGSITPAASTAANLEPTLPSQPSVPWPVRETPVVNVEARPSPAASAPVVSSAQSKGAPTARPLADLSAEIALVDDARDAMAARAYARALDTLRRYDSTYPQGSFRPEATALRIECLMKAGHTAEARALGERFVAKHRGSPLADRVTRLLGAKPP